MENREKALIIGTALAGVLLGTAVLLNSPGSPQRLNQTVTASFQGTGATVDLQVADSPDEREKGLMHRRDLPGDEGMLFVYNDSQTRSFWMKNTYIPLDIIFLNSTRHVINVETARPEPDTPDEQLTRYTSEEPAQYVIEVNAGFADNYSIRKGIKVNWPE
jgi:uncharacterized membrane protein (UPF0127 family)